MNFLSKKCWNCGAIVFIYALKAHNKICRAGRYDNPLTSKEISSSLESEIPHTQINNGRLTKDGKPL